MPLYEYIKELTWKKWKWKWKWKTTIVESHSYFVELLFSCLRRLGALLGYHP